MNFFSSSPSSAEEGSEALRGGSRRRPVGGADHVADEPGRLLGVASDDTLGGGVAHEDHVEGKAHLPEQLDRAADGVSAQVLAFGHVRPVRGVGVHDRVREQHHPDVGPPAVGVGELAGLEERVVEVRELAVVAIAGDLVHRDLALPPEQDQPVALPAEEAEHLLQRRHPLLLGIEGRQRGRVVDEEEDERRVGAGRGGSGRGDGEQQGEGHEEARGRHQGSILQRAQGALRRPL